MQALPVDRLKQVAIGETIVYKLLPHQLPRNPEHVYHGIVKRNITVAHLFVVAYEDVEDFVRYEQVVEVK